MTQVEPRSELHRGLVLTVGRGRPNTRIDLAKALASSVHHAGPDIVVLLCSEGSVDMAELVQAETSLIPRPDYDIDIMPDAIIDDVEATFERTLAAIRKIISVGVPPNQIYVGYTSGSKSMSAGAVMAATAYDCPMQIIRAERDAETGDAIPETEEFVTFAPSALLAFQELQIARRMIEELQFHSAISICDSINQRILGHDDQRLLEALRLAARGYMLWDRFDQQEALGELRQAMAIEQLPARFRVSERQFRMLENIGQHVSNAQDEIRNEDYPRARDYTEFVVADLLANAERRMLEREWADASARHYRVIEMVAHLRLWEKHGRFNALNPDARILMGRVNSRTQAKRIREIVGSQRRINLNAAYLLLEQLNDPLGDEYMNHGRQLLDPRHNSLIGHWIIPVDRAAAQEIQTVAGQLSRLVYRNLLTLTRRVQFPWLRSPSPSAD